MALITREQLANDPQYQDILSTIDGPISDYFNNRLQDKSKALDTIDQDFSSAESAFYGKGQAIGFNLHRCRLQAILIHTCFLFNHYQDQLEENSEEYLLIESLHASFNFIWQHPVIAFQSSEGIAKLCQLLQAWTEQAKHGPMAQQQQILLSIYLFITIAQLNIDDLPFYVKAFLSQKIKDSNQQLKQQARVKLLELDENIKMINSANAQLKSHDQSLYQSLIQGIKQNHRQQLADLEKVSRKSKALLFFLEQIDQGVSFWSLFNEKKEAHRFIFDLVLSADDKQKWYSKFKYERKNRIKKFWQINTHKNHSISQEDVKHAIEEKIITLAEQFCDFTPSLSNPENIIADACLKIKSCHESVNQQSLNAKLQQLQQLETNIEQLSIEEMLISPMANHQEAMAHITTLKLSPRVNNETELLMAHIDHAYLELHDLKNECKKKSSKVKQLTNALLQINDIISELSHQSQQPDRQQQFSQLLAMIRKSLLANESLPENTTNAAQVINQITDYYHQLEGEVDRALWQLESAKKDINHGSLICAYDDLKQSFESYHHQGFFAKLIMFLSPSYRRCCQLCHDFIEQIEQAPAQQASHQALSLKQALTSNISSSNWWDIGRFKSQTLLTHFSHYTFFDEHRQHSAQQEPKEHQAQLKDIACQSI